MLNNCPPSRDAFIVILRTCDYDTFRGKMNFADAISLRILRWDFSLDYWGEPNVIKGFL